MSEPCGPSPTGVPATLGVVAVAVLCCAGPALLAGGVLAGLGGLLRNPLLIGGGVLIVLASAAAVLIRRHRAPAGTRSPECADTPGRPPVEATPDPATRHAAGSRMVTNADGSVSYYGPAGLSGVFAADGRAGSSRRRSLRRR